MKNTVLCLFLALLISGVIYTSEDHVSAETRGISLPTTVSVDTVFPEADYELDGNMHIESGVTVTFEAGSEISVPDSTYRISTSGSLYLSGTMGKPIVIRSQEASPDRGMYYGLIFNSNSIGSIHHTKILNADTGVLVNPGAEIDIWDTEFRNCSNVGIYLNSFESAGKIYQPRDILIKNSKFYDNIVSIRENGINNTIDGCYFEKSYYHAIEVGSGISPSSSGLKVDDCSFERNIHYDIYLNGTNDETWVHGTTIDHCFFNKGPTYGTDSIYAPGLVSDLDISRNTMHRSQQTRKIRILGGDNITVSWNHLYGNAGESYQESILDLWNTDDVVIMFNTIFGSSPYRGNTKCVSVQNGDRITASHNKIYDSCNYGIRIDNCTDVVVDGNEIKGGVYNIFVVNSAPVSARDNTISDGTHSNGWGVGVQWSYGSRVIGDIEISGNTAEHCRSGIYTNGNPKTILKNNDVSDCYFGYSIDTFEEDHLVLIDNCSAWNSSRNDIMIEGYLGNITVHATNCSMNLSRISSDVLHRHQHMDLYWTSYVKVSAVDELGNPEDYTFTLKDGDGSTIYQDDVSGTSNLIEGSPLHLFQNYTLDLMMVDPHGALMDYEIRDGDAVHNGKVNLTSYRELFAILDHAPIFNDPAPVRFPEDTVKSFDPWDFFDDREELEVTEIKIGKNLTINGASVTNLHPNWTGQDTVTFRAYDAFGNHTDGVVTFIAEPVQDSPMIMGAPSEIIIIEDSKHTMNLSLYGVDGDDDPLIWSVEGDENLTLDLNETHWNLDIIPDADWFGSSWMEVFLNDTVEVVRKRIDITVDPINDPPVFTPPLNWNVTVKRGELTTVNISSMYHDIDDTELIFSTDSEQVTIFGGVLLILFPAESEYTLSSVNIRLEDPSGANTTVPILIYIENVTIIEPPEEEVWDITHVDLNVDNEGDWEIDVYGEPNMTVYIVIEGVGSFKLDESRLLPGNYSINLDSALFEGGEDYSYYFTNISGGLDLAPSRSDTVAQPGEEKEDREFPWPAIIAALLVALIIIAAMMFVMRSRPDEEFEE